MYASPSVALRSGLIVAATVVAVAAGGCGTSGGQRSDGVTPGPAQGGGSVLHAHPQAVEPVAGQPGAVVDSGSSSPVGDVNAHAPPLSQVRAELRLELVAARATNATYINPLQFVTVWGRTDQGIDAQLPVGAPILAPGRVKVLATIPNWYAGQPLVYFELLDGPNAGKVQYVAEQITAIAPPGSVLARGQAIARYAASGTSIEYGWSTPSGVTLARATSGYEEGQRTPAGIAIRDWLNSLGAGAGSG